MKSEYFFDKYFSKLRSSERIMTSCEVSLLSLLSKKLLTLRSSLRCLSCARADRVLVDLSIGSVFIMCSSSLASKNAFILVLKIC